MIIIETFELRRPVRAPRRPETQDWNLMMVRSQNPNARSPMPPVLDRPYRRRFTKSSPTLGPVSANQ